VGLEEHGAIQPTLDGDDSWIEAFEMADLQNAIALTGEFGEARRLFLCGGDRLFDEQIDARLQEGCGHGFVSRGGDADGRGIDGEIAALSGRQAAGNRGENRDREFQLQRRGARGVGLDDRGKADREAPLLEIAIDAEMIAAEGSRAADRNVQRRKDHRIDRASALTPAPKRP
jgi:hypothetical protein